MAYSPSDKTRFEQAKALAAQLVRDARRGDVLSIVLMADPPRVVVGDASPSANQDEVLKEIEAITLPHGGTDLVASFAAIDRVLEVSTHPPQGGHLPDRPPGRELAAGTGVAEALKRAIAKLDRPPGAVGRDRPGQGRRREPRGDRPPARLAGRHPRRPGPQGDRHGPQLRAEPGRSTSRPGSLVDGQLGPDQSVPEIAVGGEATFAFSPSVLRRRRPPGRGPDRRRPADARQQAGGWPCRSASSSTSCSSTASPRPSRSSPRPTTWPRRSTPRLEVGRAPPRRSGPRSSTSRSSARGNWPRSTRWSSATSPSSPRPRSPRSTPTSSRGAAWSSSAATRSIAENYNQTPLRRRQGAPARRRSAGSSATPRRSRGRSSSTPRTTSTRSSASSPGPTPT